MPSLLSRPRQWILSWRESRDARKLAALFPSLEQWETLPAPFRKTLEDAHRHYVQNVSSPEMAVSWESCRLLCSLANVLRPQRILDLGSGFSSYLLRSWAQALQNAAHVVSVDDNAFWLEKTREFLKSKNLDTGELHTWESFSLLKQRPFDLIFHDLGSMETRAATLPAVLKLRAPEGIVVLDDVHKRAYRPRAMLEVERAGLEYISAGRLTHDAFGRAAAIAVSRKAA
jgi:predicted O-methyltransferase YrrM